MSNRKLLLITILFASCVSFFLLIISINCTPGLCSNGAYVLRYPIFDNSSHHLPSKVARPAAPGRTTSATSSDIFICLRTSAKSHHNRLNILLNTWIPTAEQSVYVTTDNHFPEVDSFTSSLRLNRTLNGQLIVTNCRHDHSPEGLCCKFQVALNKFWELQSKRWFCHFDDDTYLNYSRLKQMLASRDVSKPWYIGKPSLDHPMKIPEPIDGASIQQLVAFWFATGGAGICLSRVLIDQLSGHLLGTSFARHCGQVRLPDDCTLGFIVKQFSNISLASETHLHSHLEPLDRLSASEIANHITLSYSLPSRQTPRTNRLSAIGLGGRLMSNDPSRFYTLHCLLHPNVPLCNR